MEALQAHPNQQHAPCFLCCLFCLLQVAPLVVPSAAGLWGTAACLTSPLLCWPPSADHHHQAVTPWHAAAAGGLAQRAPHHLIAGTAQLAWCVKLHNNNSNGSSSSSSMQLCEEQHGSSSGSPRCAGLHYMSGSRQRRSAGVHHTCITHLFILLSHTTEPLSLYASCLLPARHLTHTGSAAQ
jgi:hypothetical protein